MHPTLVDAKYTKGTSRRADALRKDPAAPQVEDGGEGEDGGEDGGEVEDEVEIANQDRVQVLL